MRLAKELFSDESRTYIQNQIRENLGNEVFFRAIFSQENRVTDVQVVARGNSHAVPAQLDLPSDSNLVVHNHPSGDLTPSEEDLAIASYLLGREVAFVIVDNEVENVNVVVEPVALKKAVSIDVASVEQVFATGGPLEQIYEGFEHRDSQMYMAAEVARTFNYGKHAVIEAPTGTGKSLAYLVPLAMWALANKERGLVCTNTLNLQQQLLDKDIPVVKKIVGENLRVVQVKGRNNYLCLRKLRSASEYQEQLFEEFELSGLEEVIAWADSSSEGLRSELSSVADEIWERVCSDSDSCAGLKCAMGKECFFRKARREATAAHILVANHAIFFADMAVRGDDGPSSSVSVFPSCQRIVIDEAHNIEEVATDYFGYSLSAMGLARKLGRLYHTKRKHERGLLMMIRNLLLSASFDAQPLLEIIETDIIPQLQEIRSRAREIFESAGTLFATNSGSSTVYSVRITEAMRQSPVFKERIVGLLSDLEILLSRGSKSLVALYEQWLLVDEKSREEHDPLFLQILSYSQKLTSDAAFVSNFVHDADERTVYWAQQRMWRGNPYLVLMQAPIQIDEILNQYFFRKYRGVVYTSATLAVNNRFDFFEKRIGLSHLDQNRRSALTLPAVFNYSHCSILGLPVDLPPQNSDHFIDEFAFFATRLIPVTRGRLFFLFTSWRMMDDCYQAVMRSLPAQWREGCLKQGDMPRHFLLDEFQRRSNAVLFGVNSFWEGVDVKGEKLVAVVIVKLPFQVPTDPVIQARTELIERAGGSSFMEYSLPNAVIKLKQGFGRLIRTQQDYGAVFILDSRVRTKQYGSIFLNSLPPARKIVGDSDNLVTNMAQFLGSFE